MVPIMNAKQLISSVCACLTIAASALGCSVSTNDPTPAPPAIVVEPAPTLPLTGTLVLSWTIDGLRDRNECFKSVAAEIEISVYDVNGAPAGTFVQQCEIFTTSIQLGAGSYSATALLVDGAGQARTTTLAIAPFTLQGNDTLDIQVDFPGNSFLQ
jgi:hypothetical protein